MDLNFTEEQNLLRESLSRYLADNYSFEHRKGYLEAGSSLVAQSLDEMGLNALTLSEDDGGFGGNSVDTAIVMEELGRALVTEPYLGSTVIGTALLAGKPGDVVGNGKSVAAALTEMGGRYDLNHVATKTSKNGDGYKIDGSKVMVLNATDADTVLVTARLNGDLRDQAGIGLFAVTKDAEGMSTKGYVTQDGMQAGDVDFDGVEAALLVEDAWPTIDKAFDQVNSAICAEAVGAMEAVTKLTKEYLQTRQQFGRPLATFQALQFRLVDMMVAVTEARAISLKASMLADSNDVVERNRTVSAAKVKVCEAARLVGQDAIQLHGGIGMTNEYAAGHYFKRLTMICQSFGDRDWHLKRFIG